MTNMEKLAYILLAVTTPLFIAFQIWYFRNKRKHGRDGHDK